MTANNNRNHIEPAIKIENREFKARVESALKSGGVRLTNKTGNPFLTESEVARAIKFAKAIRQGNRLAEGAPLGYLKIDGETIALKSYGALKRELGACIVDRAKFRIFRNFDKGITISFDG
jgi:hypothetical protein